MMRCENLKEALSPEKERDSDNFHGNLEEREYFTNSGDEEALAH